MERKKKTSVFLVAVGLLGVLLVSLFGIGSQPISALPASPQSSESASLVPPNPIPGVIYTGKYIKIGVNNGGTFGVWTATLPATGFQFPIGPLYESLAVATWAEGYLIAYKVQRGTIWVDNRAYWWPDLGWPPPAASRIVPIYAKQVRNDDNRAIWEVRVQTVDKVLNVTFKFSFPKPQKYVLLETKITNTGVMGSVRDVLYKRIVDWDIHGYLGNQWSSDAHAAYASWFNATAKSWIEMSVAGYTKTAIENQVSYVDLYAWDDYYTRDPGKYDIQSHDQPLYGDGNAAVYYDLGTISKGVTKPVMTVYQAGWHFDHGIDFTTYTLTIKHALFTPGKTNPPPGTYVYYEGNTATVYAISGGDSWFTHWELDGYNYGSTNPISITMNADHTLIAFFGPG